MNKMRRLLLIISILYITFSCSNTSKQNNDNTADVDSLNLVSYAKNFRIYKYKSGYKLIIDNLTEKSEFYIFNDSINVPEDLIDEEIIKTPIKSVVAFSSTQWSVFQIIDEISKVKGILESSYTRNSEILDLVDKGLIEDVGYENNINTEKLIKLQADIILFTPYPTVDYSNIESLTSSVLVPFPDYLESHPLGRAEWMKVVGLLCGKEEQVNKYFDEVANRYESLCNLCSDVKNKPTVFSDLPFENQWYVPGGDSYIAKIFADAGADYIWKDNKSTGSLHVDAENVLFKAQNADYWRVINSYDNPFTYDNLAKENELYSTFDAFKNKRLLVCNARECGYFERSQYEPDVLLADFIYHFHPELLKKEYENYFPTYFKKLIK